jgi:hypothetical protein
MARRYDCAFFFLVVATIYAQQEKIERNVNHIREGTSWRTAGVVYIVHAWLHP